MHIAMILPEKRIAIVVRYTSVKLTLHLKNIIFMSYWYCFSYNQIVCFILFTWFNQSLFQSDTRRLFKRTNNTVKREREPLNTLSCIWQLPTVCKYVWTAKISINICFCVFQTNRSLFSAKNLFSRPVAVLLRKKYTFPRSVNKTADHTISLSLSLYDCLDIIRVSAFKIGGEKSLTISKINNFFHENWGFFTRDL